MPVSGWAVPLVWIPLEDWRWIVDINLMGVVHGVDLHTADQVAW